MYKEKIVAVVIPAYNEETQIQQVLASLPSYIDHIVVIDDKSADGTVGKVREAQRADPRIILLLHEENQGCGGAKCTGYKWARDNNVDVAIAVDGDGQMDPEDMERLCAPVAADETDYAKGNRLFHADACSVIPKFRFVGNFISSFLTKIASGYWSITDCQTGYTAISKRALHAVDWDCMFKRYGYPNDILVRLNVADMRVRDVPIRPVYGVGEKSSMKVMRVMFSLSLLLLRLYVWRLWKKYFIKDPHPLVLFAYFSLAQLALGGLLLVRFFWLWAQTGHAPELTLVLMLFCFSMGFQGMFFSIWFDMERNKHLQ